MQSMGFRFEKDLEVKEGRRWLDKSALVREGLLAPGLPQTGWPD